MLRTFLLACASAFALHAAAQSRTPDMDRVRQALADAGVPWETVGNLRLADQYATAHSGLTHSWYRQQFRGIDIWNTEIAVHQRADGSIFRLTHRLLPVHHQKVRHTEPGMTPADALATVLQRAGMGLTPRITGHDATLHKWTFDGTDFHGTAPTVQLMVMPILPDSAALVYNVNYHDHGASHWWNVRVDAHTGREFERNDWTVQCRFDHDAGHAHGAEDACAAPLPAAPEEDEEAMPLAGPNSYRVYAMPTESPSHGPRTVQVAPWTAAPNASPFGWHDTNGAPGAEYTYTRGNNVRAQEDQNGNNGTGYAPSGGGSLDFDFPIDLGQAPAANLDAAITNLFYWNNIIHDVMYQYGFDEPSGNFQQNNYGNGGQGSDYVNADALDGSGTDNANFSTPPDGDNPRMQMYRWTYTTPDRDSDLDNGVIAHEYGHGISNRLVGGPSNVDCLWNAEQMGEGWSDYFGLMLTMKAGDQGSDPRGVGTYLMGQPVNGTGIRPAPYSTDFGINGYTYASTNSGSLSQPHGIGFVWCTMLWEMTWELIGIHGFDPDIYNGNGGNNIALHLVIHGLKLTACNPGFEDGRDAILAADQALYGGANTTAIWVAFARRGLGLNADQGSTNSRFDQTESFSLPLAANLSATELIAPSGSVFACAASQHVQVRVMNTGIQPQSNFPVSYRVNGGAIVTETFTGTLANGEHAIHTFATPVQLQPGPNTVEAWTALGGDEYAADDLVAGSATLMDAVAPPFSEGVDGGVPAPAGWQVDNPDGAITWEVVNVPVGPNCGSSNVWLVHHYGYPTYGALDHLTTPAIDLGGAANSTLTFDHAYVRYTSQGYTDTLIVQVSADCGATWDAVFMAGGDDLATAPPANSTWTPSNCGQWAHNTIDLSAYDGQQIFVRFVSVNGYGNSFFMDNVAVSATLRNMQVKVFLQGPYDPGTGLMGNGIRTAGLLPATEPYTALGFPAIGGGGETIAPEVMNAAGGDAPVDWVRIEYRQPGSPATVAHAQHAIVQRDGDVVSPLTGGPLPVAPNGASYHVAVRHRNHLAAMTATPVSFAGPLATVDLTLPGTATYGTGARRSQGGVMMLWAGNVNGDDMVRYTGASNDREAILSAVGGTVPTQTVNGYLPQDTNMNGQVRYTGNGNDREVVLQNVGAVPTSTLQQQLP
ncbi:MAG: M36 family metallopeptidase [Flavobacteriales bacterium]|jgi:hypothetical protein|nr:M36 family metallopeptidase [Flavobacteriales bacterium]